MRVAVLGAGIQARAIVDDFVRFSGAERIGVADIDGSKAEALAQWSGDARVQPSALDVSDSDAVVAWLGPYDAAVSAVPYAFNAALARAAIDSRTHFTDLGGNHDVVERELALDDEARAAGTSIVPDLGLAPGLVTLLAADLARAVDPPRRLHMRVGGLPQVPAWPLGYRLLFAPEGLVNEYVEPCRLLRHGRQETVPALGEPEALDFQPFGRLEAFLTSGGTSTLVTSLRGEVEDLTYKTLRYPGHRDGIRLLRSLGLLDDAPVEVEGRPVAPRRVTEALLRRHLGGEAPDVVLARVVAEGTRHGQPVRIIEELEEYPDPGRGLSAMARCTGYPAAIVTTMLARGEITARGALPQERCVPVARFREDLAARGIEVRRRVEG